MKIKACLLSLICLLLFSCVEKQEKKQVSSFEDLSGSEVAVILGSTYDLMISDCSGVEIKRVPTTADLFTSLEFNKCDYILMDSVALLDPERRQKNFAIDFSGFYPNDYAVAFRLNDHELCESFNKFLADLKVDGLYDKILERWTNGDENCQMPDLQLPTNAKPIVIGSMSVNPPFAFIKNNQWAGFEVELLTRFAYSIGRPIRFDNYDFGALVAALYANKIDAIASTMTVTEERKKEVLFSDSYYTTVGCCISNPVDDGGAEMGFWQKIKTSFNKNLITEKRYIMLWNGFLETINISFFALLIGTVLGAIVCYLRMGKNKFGQMFAKCYVELMRGIPILVFLMIMFYVIFSSTKISASWVAIIAFAMNFAAYVSEMFRASVQSIDKGQTEAGIALGFNKVQTFVYIVAPQAIRNVIPVYRGEAISLIKNTSVVGYIAIQDLTKVSDIIRSRTFDAFFPLIVISIIYFILAWLLGVGLDCLNRKISSK